MQMKNYFGIATTDDIALGLFLLICVFTGLFFLDHSNQKNMEDKIAQLKAKSANAAIMEKTQQRKTETQEDKKSKDINKITVTAYSARISETDDTPMVTANMKRVREGTVAVSRDLFEEGWTFGRIVHIHGIGVFQINDLMAEKHQKRIDIFMWDTAKALEFGKQTAKAALFDS
jgi:3D (Asp-Asp-Asp) domain-containing protein